MLPHVAIIKQLVVVILVVLDPTKVTGRHVMAPLQRVTIQPAVILLRATVFRHRRVLVLCRKKLQVLHAVEMQILAMKLLVVNK